jgi:hypothetical protein
LRSAIPRGRRVYPPLSKTWPLAAAGPRRGRVAQKRSEGGSLLSAPAIPHGSGDSDLSSTRCPRAGRQRGRSSRPSPLQRLSHDCRREHRRRPTRRQAPARPGEPPRVEVADDEDDLVAVACILGNIGVFVPGPDLAARIDRRPLPPAGAFLAPSKAGSRRDGTPSSMFDFAHRPRTTARLLDPSTGESSHRRRRRDR